MTAADNDSDDEKEREESMSDKPITIQKITIASGKVDMILSDANVREAATCWIELSRQVPPELCDCEKPLALVQIAVLDAVRGIIVAEIQRIRDHARLHRTRFEPADQAFLDPFRMPN